MSEHYTDDAALYDAAFDWDVAHEVTAIARLSQISEGRVLEPMCGSGRLIRAFARAGFETVGIDSSSELLAVAAARYARAGLSGSWIEADVTAFDLAQPCSLAVCPVNSLAHLPSEDAMTAHLDATARNLLPGASYWVQLDLHQPGYVGPAPEWTFQWHDQTVKIAWSGAGYHNGFETQLARYTFPDGQSIEHTHEMKVWTFAEWMSLLSRTKFQLRAAFTGAGFQPLRVAPSIESEHVAWQQLVLSA